MSLIENIMAAEARHLNSPEHINGGCPVCEDRGRQEVEDAEWVAEWGDV